MDFINALIRTKNSLIQGLLLTVGFYVLAHFFPQGQWIYMAYVLSVFMIIFAFAIWKNPNADIDENAES